MEIRLVKDLTNGIYWGSSSGETGLLVVPFKPGGDAPDVLKARVVTTADLQRLETKKAIAGLTDALKRLLDGERPL